MTLDPDADLSQPRSDADGKPAVSPHRAGKSSRRNLVEWIAVIGGAVLVAIVIRSFLFQTFWIPSPSMS
ncbi:MAG: hypothetical protein ABIP03_10980, partial [Aquihabitans sp.]